MIWQFPCWRRLGRGEGNIQATIITLNISQHRSFLATWTPEIRPPMPIFTLNATETTEFSLPAVDHKFRVTRPDTFSQILNGQPIFLQKFVPIWLIMCENSPFIHTNTGSISFLALRCTMALSSKCWLKAVTLNVRPLPAGRNSHIPPIHSTHVRKRMAHDASGAYIMKESKIGLSHRERFKPILEM